MADIFSKTAQVISSVDGEVVKAAVWVSHLYGEVASKLSALSKDEPQLVSAVTDLVAKGEVFLAASVPAISDKGLDLPADSAAFAALKAFLSSFEAAAATLKQLIAEAK